MILMLLAAFAVTPAESTQIEELDKVRARIANEVQLSAFDLVDELIYGWTEKPVFDEPTSVVLAGVTVPVGLGTGLQAQVENHFSNVLMHHSQANVQLSHCPQCMAVVVHSGPEGTVVTRGMDNPDVLADLGEASGRHALFLDIEAEGAWLVLRARITRLTPDLPIVWSHTISSNTSTPPLLRDPTGLKSAEEARKEYLKALKGRGPWSVPVRFAIRAYAQPPQEAMTVAVPPMIWLQSGVEFGFTNARAWTASLLVGYSWVPTAYQGAMGQARLGRLLTGRSRSRVRPDVYIFAGAAVMTVWGSATAPFSSQPVTADDIIQALDERSTRTAFGAWHLGLDMRIGSRIGASIFMEGMPTLNSSPNIGDFIRPFGFVGIKTIGTEVAIWF